MDTESELQMLVRRLGAEASGILDSESGGMDRLTVPLLKKEGKFKSYSRWKICEMQNLATSAASIVQQYMTVTLLVCSDNSGLALQFHIPRNF